MRKFLSKFVFTILLGSLFILSFSTIKSHAAGSCFPTCSSIDGRFLAVTEGILFQTLTPQTLNVRLVVPGDIDEFSLGIFDGDHNGNTNGVLNWDAGATTNEPYSYVLIADPDRDDTGPEVFMTHSDFLQNNAWVDFVIASDPMALDADGNYVYTLAISLLSNVPAANAFKIRTDLGVLEIDEIFTFVAQMSSFEDFLIIFPNADFTDGTIDPEDLVGTTYSGRFSFFFEIPEPADELVFWDGDSDRGNFDGTATDTDDPNTPNEIPAFAPSDADTVAEGVNPPDPSDDLDPTGGPLQINMLYVRHPSVTYSLLSPNGELFHNSNPSGNREWENFVVSTLSSDPNLVDFNPQTLPAGTYEIRFDGLDMANFVSINPLFPIVLRGEVIPDPDDGGGGDGGDNGGPVSTVPTMSEWGLLAVAVVIGLIGIAVVRRKLQHS